jgi:hypothetical protein
MGAGRSIGKTIQKAIRTDADAMARDTPVGSHGVEYLLKSLLYVVGRGGERFDDVAPATEQDIIQT